MTSPLERGRALAQGVVVAVLGIVCLSVEPCASAGESRSPAVAHVGPQRANEDDFLAWARRARVPVLSVAPQSDNADLAALGAMIGDAPVVALTEAVHMGAEPLEFRNRLFQYLVEKKGFTAIAIESGIVEGRIVHDYVRGGPGDFATVMTQGISWTFDQAPQNQALVRWLRAYNADPRHSRKLNFYGFDVPGSPGNAGAHRNVDTALREALEYLAKVDPAAAAALHARLDPILPNLHFDLGRTAGGSDYRALTEVERDALTSAIADLIALMERREASYAATSTADYQWAYRAAIGARQVDGWLRQIPVGWKTPDGRVPQMADWMRILSPSMDVRDRGQADNLDWIFSREGKVLVYAARYHLSSVPLTSQAGERQVAGTYLRRRLGERLVSIGNLVGGGSIGCADFHMTLEKPAVGSFDGIAGGVHSPSFLLDLRTAPPSVKQWLDQDYLLDTGGGDSIRLQLGKAFDILFYIDRVTPACPKTG